MLTLSTALFLIISLAVVDGIAIGYILVRKILVSEKRKKSKHLAQCIIGEFPGMSDDAVLRKYNTRSRRELLLDQYIAIRQSMKIEQKLDLRIRKLIAGTGIGSHYCKRLQSLLPIRRIDAAVHLGHIGGNKICRTLERRLLKEQNAVVQVYIAYALSEIRDGKSIMPLVQSLVGAPEWYRQKVTLFLNDFEDLVRHYLPELEKRREREIRLYILNYADDNVSDDLYSYIKNALDDADTEIRILAARAFTKNYSDDPCCTSLLTSDVKEIKAAVVTALGKLHRIENARLLLHLLNDPEVGDHVVTVLSAMCSHSSAILEYLMHRYDDEAFLAMRKGIVEILSNRIEYFIVKLNTIDRTPSRNILNAMVEQGLVNTIFSYLIHNKNREIENEILDILRQNSAKNENVSLLARHYLDERILKKLQLPPITEEVTPAAHRKSAIRRSKLALQLVAILLIFPVAFSASHWHEFATMSPITIIKRYIIDGNYLLIYYSTATSLIYLLLLLFSAFGAVRQYDYSRAKNKTFLFRRNILPGISIIAPAFNEEAGIIESVNSLLNLRYPDHEVIVVNDGSRDKTLQRVIDYFRLEKVDVLLKKELATQPIRGIYRNSSFPKLSVIDKVNGGKADSLNAGINCAVKEYFCGIDADSLLSEESLLKVVSGSLDIDHETVAMGGNIFPVNGCTITRGMLASIGIPKSPIANFQFIEYIRAFMAGRVGWAFIDCMLIISGAFGLFKRSRVVECGGYLTSSGKFGLDTVGEDMELVVRLTKYMKENRLPYKIGYSHNANCWTEVPEKISVLLRQRDRWHRGLIEILSFHKKMVLNPRFGRIGFIAMPYFLFFEIFGPWIELQGYCMLAGAIFTGLINPVMALWLFIATVMFGVFISVASLIIAEQEMNYFSMREVIKLTGFAIAENFGFRQLMSMWRVVGYISALRGASGWGKMVRRGFLPVPKSAS